MDEIIQYWGFWLLLAMAGAMVIGVGARTTWPLAPMLVTAGFILSELWTRGGFDTGLRADSIRWVIVNLCLPLLLLSGGATIKLGLLRRYWLATLVLAGPGLLLSFILISSIVFFGIGYPDAFPWSSALLVGAILMAMEPGLLGRFPLNTREENVEQLLEAESQIADILVVTAVFLIGHNILGNYFLSTGIAVIWQVVVSVVPAGGLGILFGWSLGRYGKRFPDWLLVCVACLLALLFFYLGMRGLFSGAIATGLFAITLGRYRDISVLQLPGLMALVVVLLVLGVSISVDLFTERWLAMLIAVVAVIVGRLGAVLLLALTPFVKSKPLDTVDYWLLQFGAMRGGIVVALVFALPAQLSSWWTIQAMGFAVVVFCTIVQVPCYHLLSRKKR